MTHRLRLVRVLRAPSFWAIVALLVGGVLLIRWIGSIGGIDVFSERFGHLAPLVTIPIHIVVAMTPFPSDAIAIANGSLYGFLYGFALNLIGWYTAALLEFELGRRAREDFDLDERVSSLPHFLKRLPVEHPLFLIGARQIPWLGGHVTTLVPGAAGVAWSRFWWCAAISVVPSSALMAAIGAGLVQLLQ